MPEMMDIYKHHAENYDELVNAEDWQGRLRECIRQLTDWRDGIVCEAGIGTGRLTRYYLDMVERVYGFDRERHMLDRCRLNLADHAGKLILTTGLNENLPKIAEPADIFIEGWSFGHTISEHYPEIETVLQTMLTRIRSNLAGTGTIILIETLGTNVSRPAAPSEALDSFYRLLETRHRFRRHVIETGYRFGSNEEAARIMGFFFGDRMRYSVEQYGGSVIPEFTGVWTKQLDRGGVDGHQRIDHSDAV